MTQEEIPWGPTVPAPRFQKTETAPAAMAEDVPSLALLRLSEWLRQAQEISREFGYERIWIGGGSARVLLDHVCFGLPLEMRDLDLFFIKGTVVEEQEIVELTRQIEDSGMASFQNEPVSRKVRVNPELSGPERLAHHAGYGAHLFRAGFPILSMSFFHSWKELELNGILNIDRVLVALDADESLFQLGTQTLRSAPYWQLVEDGKIHDSCLGYLGWVKRKPEVVNWAPLSQDPTVLSMRVIRGFAKCGARSLPFSTIQSLRALMAEEPGVLRNRFELMSTFLRTLNDPSAAIQLGMLASLGILRAVSEELQESLEGKSIEQIESSLGRGRSAGALPTPLSELERLVRPLSRETRASLMSQAEAAYPATFS